MIVSRQDHRIDNQRKQNPPKNNLIKGAIDMKNTLRNAGFTLIELLVVIATPPVVVAIVQLAR